ncbi:hypothetical protein BGZ94_000965 [Podila epigama]|nr:hypothetical protein BGZ94_000965 [Podila epigama]
MTANQTRLGFNQKKPGTARPLQNKYANKALRASQDATKDTDAGSTLPPEHLLEKMGNISQTMEERLAEYQRKKKEKASAAQSSRSLRSSTKTTKELSNDGSVAKSTTRTTRSRLTTTTVSTSLVKSSVSLVQTDITGCFQQIKTTVEIKTKETTDVEPKEKHSRTKLAASSEERSEPATIEISAQDHSEEDSIKNQYEPLPQDSQEEGESGPANHEEPILEKAEGDADQDESDDIHPLARTVVVAKPLSPRKQTKHVEEHDTYTTKLHISTPSNAISRAEETIKETSLPMPSHMKSLTAIFKALEQLIVFTKSQGQLCFYHRLKKPVELQSSRNFELKHLAQLRTVWPDGYKLTQAPCLFEGQRIQSVLIEQLAPKEEQTGYFVPRAERRLKAFLEHMEAYIEQFHKKFLTSTIPPRTDTYPHQWHPDFDIESVPPIEEGDVPLLKATVVDSSKLNLAGLTSRHALGSARASVTLPSKNETSLPSPASSVASSPASVEGGQPAAKPLTALEQLKEKIRQKQLERKEATVGLATPEEKQQRLVSSRLPAVFDLIRFKRIEVIPLKALTEQVVKSSRMPISEQEGKHSLEMLAERLPEWCSIIQLNDGPYFKVLKKADGGEHDIKAMRVRLVAGVSSR